MVFQVRETRWTCARISRGGMKAMMLSTSSGMLKTLVAAEVGVVDSMMEFGILWS
jgi:hypothetical protein